MTVKKKHLLYAATEGQWKHVCESVRRHKGQLPSLASRDSDFLASFAVGKQSYILPCAMSTAWDRVHGLMVCPSSWPAASLCFRSWLSWHGVRSWDLVHTDPMQLQQDIACQEHKRTAATAIYSNHCFVSPWIVCICVHACTWVSLQTLSNILLTECMLWKISYAYMWNSEQMKELFLFQISYRVIVIIFYLLLTEMMNKY